MYRVVVTAKIGFLTIYFKEDIRVSNQDCRNEFYREDNRPYRVVPPEKYNVFGLDVQCYRKERSELS